MKAILDALSNLLSIVNEKHGILQSELSIIEEKKSAIAAELQQIEAKKAELQARESAVSDVEDAAALRKSNQELKQKLEDRQNELTEAVNSFNQAKQRHDCEIAEKRKALDAESAEIQGRAAKLEQEIFERVNKILENVKK